MSAQPKKNPVAVKKRRHLSEATDFTPYSLHEYNNIAKSNYYALGGLGPSNMGTSMWINEDRKRKRREDYAKRMNSFALYDSYSEKY